ncbi:MAG TPA: DUF5716 family protein [Treponemataceae bacterium]|nr:DUF5716 family protein [Treponemataceae bacterium]
MATSGVFATLPEGFFSPLSSANREHYAALLVLYWRTFQEFPRGVERSVLIARYADYVTRYRAAIAQDAEESSESDRDPLTGSDSDAPCELFSRDESVSEEPSRAIAGRFLRILVGAGWMSLETLEDYTRMVNVTPWARPFFESLARIDEGLSAEYESNIVAVYSLLCSDAADENGHYAVLNAHESTVALNDSLKALLQGIKDHYERLSPEAEGEGVAGLLHRHYDLYASEILDGAYKRLKTSDNLSRYRPRILKRVREFKNDAEWLSASAGKYARGARIGLDEARSRLVAMLDEISDVLKDLDPLLDEIDRRNMQYARSSAERIRLLLEPDSSIAGRLAQIARAASERPELRDLLSPRLYRVACLGPESRYRRWLKGTAVADFIDRSSSDSCELERAEAELRLRIARQLNPARVSLWLDGRGGKERPLTLAELATDAEGWVRSLYAVLYAESRSASFGYTVSGESGKRIRAVDYEMPDLVLRRK